VLEGKSSPPAAAYTVLSDKASPPDKTACDDVSVAEVVGTKSIDNVSSLCGAGDMAMRSGADGADDLLVPPPSPPRPPTIRRTPAVAAATGTQAGAVATIATTAAAASNVTPAVSSTGPQLKLGAGAGAGVGAGAGCVATD
jgi:hypothetical protein